MHAPPLLRIIIWTGLLCLFITSLTGCKKAGRQDSPTLTKTDSTIHFHQVPAIPLILKTSEERASWLALHYWDNLAFTDTSLVHQPETEQSFADFLNVLSTMQPEVAERAIETLLQKASVSNEVFLHFCSLAEKYLYDPNSPLKNEGLYEVFLEKMLASSILEDVYKIRPSKQYELIVKNKVGKRAINITATLKNGRQIRLYDLKSRFTLIYFHNPECNDCERVRNILATSDLINKDIAGGKLVVLSVYPDEDLTAWKAHYAALPANWINGYDAGCQIKQKELYDLKAIPTLYLVDEDMLVLLKDVTPEQVLTFLANQ